MSPTDTGQYVTLAEVKNILKKAEKDREELTYEQRNALDHAQLFTKLSATATNELLKGLKKLSFLEEHHCYKIADLLPTTEDDVRAIFAKERSTLGEGEIKQILEVVGKHYVEE